MKELRERRKTFAVLAPTGGDGGGGGGKRETR